MPKGIPLTNEYIKGKKFGRLTAIEIVSRTQTYSRTGRLASVKTLVSCECECGSSGTYSWNDMQTGHTRSCGCLVIDMTVERSTKHGHARRGKVSREWIVWNLMNNRCHDPRDKSFERYGARGITVCHAWRKPDGFAAFYADMGPRPTGDYSLERVDNSLGYSPDNCIWADRITQGNNKRNNRHITWQGQTYTYAQLFRKLKIPHEDWSMCHSRLVRGWSVERMLTEPRNR